MCPEESRISALASLSNFQIKMHNITFRLSTIDWKVRRIEIAKNVFLKFHPNMLKKQVLKKEQ